MPRGSCRQSVGMCSQPQDSLTQLHLNQTMMTMTVLSAVQRGRLHPNEGKQALLALLSPQLRLCEERVALQGCKVPFVLSLQAGLWTTGSHTVRNIPSRTQLPIALLPHLLASLPLY